MTHAQGCSRIMIACASVTLALWGCGGSANNNNQGGNVPPGSVQLQEGTTVGQVVFADGDNPANGGQGQVVSGISCAPVEQLAVHYHAHLALFSNGTQIAIPEGIGIPNPQSTIQPGFINAGNCFYWLHTHDATGIIHVEAPANVSPTLGQFFAIWGQLLTPTNIAGIATGGSNNVTIFVDGNQFNGDPNTIVLQPHTQIVIE